MKAFKTIMAVAVVIMFAFGQMAFAAGGKGKGQRDGKRPPIDVLSGTPFTLTGTVDSIKDRRGGMELNDGADIHTIHGIGPAWFWESAGVTRPVVGDQITVTGYDVSFNDDRTRKIAMSVVVSGSELQLRDADTGEPVWRGMEKPNPFTEGEVISIEGNVSDITSGRRGGIEVDTASETVSVCGVGPAQYWETLGVDLPEVGDSIVVNGVMITTKEGTEKMIASSIVIDGQTVELHDAETGAPLFKGKKHKRPPRSEDDSLEQPVEP